MNVFENLFYVLGIMLGIRDIESNNIVFYDKFSFLRCLNFRCIINQISLVGIGRCKGNIFEGNILEYKRGFF